MSFRMVHTVQLSRLRSLRSLRILLTNDHSEVVDFSWFVSLILARSFGVMCRAFIKAHAIQARSRELQDADEYFEGLERATASES
jgi:hypothetical protein